LDGTSLKTSTSLEMVALEIFESHGWTYNNRLCQT
jgi:hypothetical protein